MNDLNISMMAIGIAVIANFILGFLWYTPIFGKVWAREMGYDMEEMGKDKSGMYKGMVTMLVGNFLFAYVFSHNIAAWDFVPGMTDMSLFSQAMNAAIFTWVGFFLPTDAGTMFWDKKSFKVFAINTGYHLASLILVALIIIYVR